MIPRTIEAVRSPMPIGGPVKTAPISGSDPRCSLSHGFDMGGHERREHEQAPHAVDDAGDGGEQLDRHADGSANPARRNVGQEQGDADADRDREQERKKGGDERSVDRHERAETAVTGSQSRLVTKPQPKVSNARRPPHAIDAAAAPRRTRTSQAAPAVASSKARSAPAPLLGAAVRGVVTGYWRRCSSRFARRGRREAAHNRAFAPGPGRLSAPSGRSSRRRRSAPCPWARGA